MYVFVVRGEVMLNILDVLLIVEYCYDVKGGWDFEAEIPWMQGGFEGVQQTPSKDSIVWVQLVNHIKGYIFYARILWGAKQNRQGYNSDELDSFSSKTINGLRRLFKLLLVVAHFLEGRQQKDFGLAAVVNEDFGNISSVNVNGENHSIGMWKRS
jgi:hypothetical protein